MRGNLQILQILGTEYKDHLGNHTENCFLFKMDIILKGKVKGKP